MAECHVTGPVKDREGNLLASQTVTLRYVGGLVGQDGAARVPLDVTTTTDAQGEVSVRLQPGQYTGYCAGETFTLSVPNEAAATFHLRIDQPAPVTPSIADEAAASAEDAASAAAAAIAQAGVATTAAGEASTSAEIATTAAGTATTQAGIATTAAGTATDAAETAVTAQAATVAIADQFQGVLDALPMTTGEASQAVVSIGGDALIWATGRQIDFYPSLKLSQAVTAPVLPMIDTTQGAALVAAGGDALIWTDDEGIDLIPSQSMTGRFGIGYARGSDDTIPLVSVGGDAVLWRTSGGLNFQPSTDLIEKLANEISPGGDGFPVPSVTGGENLWRTRAKIAALRRNVPGTQYRFLMVGDSWTHNTFLRGAVNDVFSARHPIVGDGFMSSNNVSPTLTGATYTLSSGWVHLDGAAQLIYGVTPDGQMRATDQNNQTATWSNMRCTRFSIYVREQGGTWRWRVDGGAWTTVADTTSGSLKRVQITGLADTPHVIEIDTSGNTGVVALAGFYMEREGVSGIVVSRFADSGVTALGMTPYLPAQQAVLTDEPHDCIMTVLGTNDMRGTTSTPAVYVNYMQSLIDAARAQQSDTDMLHIIPPQNNMAFVTPPTAYRDAIHAARASLRSEYLSLSERFGTWAQANALGLWNDDVHPNALGARVIFDDVNDLLIRM